MDPLINVYSKLDVEYPFLADPKRLTDVAANPKDVTWTLYKYFRNDPTADADTALMQGLLAWWALQRLGKVGELFVLGWSAAKEVTSVELESKTLDKKKVQALTDIASGLAEAGQLVARQYGLNSFNLDILDRYVQGPSKVPDPALLQIALGKLPKQADLEFLAPTLRVMDKSGFTEVAKQCKRGTPFPLNGGGKRSDRCTSTSVGYNTFTPSMGLDGGVILLRGRTGRYIGCFGHYGAVDGAEILYDPSTVVVFEKALIVRLTKPKIVDLNILILRETDPAPPDSRRRRRYFKELGY